MGMRGMNWGIRTFRAAWTPQGRKANQVRAVKLYLYRLRRTAEYLLPIDIGYWCCYVLCSI